LLKFRTYHNFWPGVDYLNLSPYADIWFSIKV